MAQNKTEAHDPRDELTFGDLDTYLLGAAAFQVLRAGVDLGVFDLLRERRVLSRDELKKETELSDRSFEQLLRGLLALRLVGESEFGIENAAVIERLVEAGDWDAFVNTVRFESTIVYRGQADYVESLQKNANVGIRHTPGDGATLYERLGQSAALQAEFFEYMSAWSRMALPKLLDAFDFSKVDLLLDIGGGDGTNAMAIAESAPLLRVTVMDLPVVEPAFSERIGEDDARHRVTFHPGDIFVDPFPAPVDAALFAHQLMIWSPDRAKLLLEKCYEALRPGGAAIVFSSMDEQDGRSVFAALDSVYFASVAAPEGSVYSDQSYREWMNECGFRDVSSTRCPGWSSHAVVIGRK